MLDLILTNALILCLDEERTIIKNGCLGIKDGKISVLSQKPQLAKQELDFTGKIILPPFTNCHTHLGMAFFRGVADDLSLDEWLRQHIWPLENKFVAGDFVYDAALCGVSELLENGISAFADMYFFGESLGKSAVQAKIKALIGEGILDFPSQASPTPASTFAYLKKLYALETEAVKYCPAPHSIYTCSGETIQKAYAHALENGKKFILHLSETKKEFDDCLRNFGEKPVHYLYKLGVLGKDTLLAHGVHVEKDEMDILQKTGTSVALCHKSNCKLGSGIPPVDLYLRHEVNICLGTDSVASNNSLSIWEEMRFMALLHKGLCANASLLKAEEALTIATVKGSKALGFGGQGLVLGAAADFASVNFPADATVYDPYSYLVYGAKMEVADLFIAGERLLAEGILTNKALVSAREKGKVWVEKIKASAF